MLNEKSVNLFDRFTENYDNELQSPRCWISSPRDNFRQLITWLFLLFDFHPERGGSVARNHGRFGVSLPCLSGVSRLIHPLHPLKNEAGDLKHDDPLTGIKYHSIWSRHELIKYKSVIIILLAS